MSRTLVALATYNEIENLPGLIDEILRTLPSADIVVVDDNSPDGTGTWCDARAANEPRLSCLHRPGKQGLGSATLAAAQRAIDHGYDLFVTLDADWSHHPRHLPALIDKTTSADVAIGSRYIPGGAIEGWPLHRRMASRGINRLSQLLLGLPVHDLSGAIAPTVSPNCGNSIFFASGPRATRIWKKSSGILRAKEPRSRKSRSLFKSAVRASRKSMSTRQLQN